MASLVMKFDGQLSTYVNLFDCIYVMKFDQLYMNFIYVAVVLIKWKMVCSLAISLNRPRIWLRDEISNIMITSECGIKFGNIINIVNNVYACMGDKFVSLNVYMLCMCWM